MRIVLASSNQGKIREIKEMMPGVEVLGFSDLIGPLEIEETGATFQANAQIKARAIAERLNDSESYILSDDSGISVPVLGGEPGIYSARYAGEGASDKDNLYKLIDALEAKGIRETPAFYTCAMTLIHQGYEQTVHGWMHGTALAEARGDQGFGYDPMFVPEGFDKTLGELPDAIKENLSHRGKALRLVRLLLA